MNAFNDFYSDPDDVVCAAWAQPELAPSALPRIRIDPAGLREAARSVIANEEPFVVAMVFKAPETDQRLIPHLRRAIEERKRMKEQSRGRS